MNPDLVPMLLDISIDPCDGSVHPSLQYVLIRGFTAMGWEQPRSASEDMAMEILKMIRPSRPDAGCGVREALDRFETFLNEPPEYEAQLTVREYRHEAYRKWCAVRDAVTSALSTPPAAVESDGSVETREDARRYRRLQILGCAPYGSQHLLDGNVMRFTTLDAYVDADIDLHPSRGEARPIQPAVGGAAKKSEGGVPQTRRLDDLGSVQDGLKMSKDGQPNAGLSSACIERPIEAGVTGGESAATPSDPTTHRIRFTERTLASVRTECICGWKAECSGKDRQQELNRLVTAHLERPSDPTADRREIVALSDIDAELQRQKDIEGWAPEHDDTHTRAELAQAAACYALSGTPADEDFYIHGRWKDVRDLFWPFGLEWWKPKDRRRNLVRAGALIVAEIERLDRIAALDGGR